MKKKRIRLELSIFKLEMGVYIIKIHNNLYSKAFTMAIASNQIKML